MDDLISRQAAVDALSKYVDYSDDGEQEINADCVFHTLEELPSAQPERNWIPCSERVPEPRRAVLGYAPKYQNIYAVYYDSVCGWMIWSPIRDDYFPNSQGEIIAWMPLPKPYQEAEYDG